MGLYVCVLRLQATVQAAKDGNVSSYEESPFSICFHYYFHTVDVL